MRKKKSNLENEPVEKKTRAKYDCPDALEELIGIVKCVPAKAQLPNALNIFKRKYLQIAGSEWTEPLDKDALFAQETLDATCNELLSEIEKHPHLLEYLLSKVTIYSGNIADSQEFYNRYNQFLDYRNKLRHAAEMAKMYNSERISIGKFKKFSTFLNINFENKFFYYDVDLVQKALDGTNSERLRICSICESIFWAKYKNSFTCSTPCLNALRQRRHRKTNADAINEKRRANYDRNKKLKQLKEKKNGTL